MRFEKMERVMGSERGHEELGEIQQVRVAEMVRRIVVGFDPVRVILFGSLARGEGTIHSDADLLVVFGKVRRKDKRDLAVEITRALSGIQLAKDVVVTDLEEIERRGHIVGTVLRPALQEGKVLYERPGTSPYSGRRAGRGCALTSPAHVDADIVALLAFLAALGLVAGPVALGSVLRERRALARGLGEARHLNEMLRLDDEVPSTVLRRHYEARLDEAIGGFEIREYARSPEVQREVDAYLRRHKDAGGKQ